MRQIIILLLATILTGCGGHYVHISSDVFDFGEEAGSLCKTMNAVTDVTAIHADEVELNAQAYRYTARSGFVRKGYDCQKRSKIIVPPQPYGYYPY
ncbi:MAG: hypothetical protein RLZZ230_935 [Candidatus Parcubacteria bacterium]|jgi:hypothetical protein